MEGVVEHVSCLVAQDLHAPLVVAALDLSIWLSSSFSSRGCGTGRKDGDAADAVGREPLVRQPIVRTEDDLARLELVVQIGNASGEHAGLDADAEIAHPQVEQRLVGEGRPPVVGTRGGLTARVRPVQGCASGRSGSMRIRVGRPPAASASPSLR